MDDYSSARATVLQWMRENNARLDRFAGYVDDLESIVFDPNVTWDTLQSVQAQATKLQEDLATLIELAGRTARSVSADDHELRAEVDAVGNRADALWVRFNEALREFTRLLGEVGRAHDRRPLQQKGAPGAHRLYG